VCEEKDSRRTTDESRQCSVLRARVSHIEKKLVMEKGTLTTGRKEKRRPFLRKGGRGRHTAFHPPFWLGTERIGKDAELAVYGTPSWEREGSIWCKRRVGAARWGKRWLETRPPEVFSPTQKKKTEKRHGQKKKKAESPSKKTNKGGETALRPPQVTALEKQEPAATGPEKNKREKKKYKRGEKEACRATSAPTHARSPRRHRRRWSTGGKKCFLWAEGKIRERERKDCQDYVCRVRWRTPCCCISGGDPLPGGLEPSEQNVLSTGRGTH